MDTTSSPRSTLSDIIARNEREIVDDHLKAQQLTRAEQLMNANELRRQSAIVVAQLRQGQTLQADDPSYNPLRQTLANISRTRALQGFTPSETATFIFSLKDAILPHLERVLSAEPRELAHQALGLNRLLDAFGLFTFEIYVQSRESIIREQSQAILELSTPVVELWDEILAVPLIGSVDTARTQQIMENLLTRIVETGSNTVIIDITGVPVVDTAVAKHLLQTIAAARLLGAEAVIVGISARIAQTLVHLGVDLSEVVTRTTMAKGLEYALGRTGLRIVRGHNGQKE